MFTVFDSRVRYSETDRNGNLSVKSLFDYLQDCCTFQSEDLGESIPVLQERHRAWLLAFWDIDIVRQPRRGEKIRIWTWPHYFKRFFAYRGHAVETEDGTVLVRGNSIWTFVDMENGKALNIPQEEIDRITEPFYMVDRSRSKKLGGVGLGLALVKEIVKAHGGRLSIESEVGKGTTVRVLLQS